MCVCVVVASDAGRAGAVWRLYDNARVTTEGVAANDQCVRIAHPFRCASTSWAYDWRSVLGPTSLSPGMQYDGGTAQGSAHAVYMGVSFHSGDRAGRLYTPYITVSSIMYCREPERDSRDSRRSEHTRVAPAVWLLLLLSCGECR